MVSFPTGPYVLFYYADEDSVGIARILHGSRDLATAGSPKLDVFTYDVGAEVRANRWGADRTVTFTPLAEPV